MRPNKTLIKLIIALSTILQLSNCTQFATFTNSKAITNVVNIKWKFENDDVILLIEKTEAGHLWLGIGKSMSGSDIIRIEKTSGGTDLTVQDCYVNGYVAPTCVETNNLTVEHKEATSTSLKVQIRRKMVTGETAKDKDLIQGVNSFIYSYTSSDAPEKHGSNYGVVSIDFSAADGGNLSPDGSKKTGMGYILSFAAVSLLIMLAL